MNSTGQSATASSERLGVVTFLMVYVFPVQLIVGLIGNIFNLIVLLSKSVSVMFPIELTAPSPCTFCHNAPCLETVRQGQFLMCLRFREMRTKTNILLAMMALADMLFLIFMVPHSLMFNTYFTKQQAFRRFFLYGNHHITGLVNLCGFTSAW
ncbi:hypothetical protein L596_018961 [Steinernema carpocapsae]|nr:hypothetical protein L596_018961 [Steinernema carpocapsae]